MAKLYYRYGTMGSAKTLNLLAVRHNYELQGKPVILLKPAMDTRFGDSLVKSRAGLEHEADILVSENTVIDRSKLKGIYCILADECQFLSEFVVNQLRDITISLDIPVIAYGLRTDFQTHLFEGSRRLMELSDSIEEIKNTCQFCDRKATQNLRHDKEGKAITDGDVILLGTESLYSPVCYKCYKERTEGHS